MIIKSERKDRGKDGEVGGNKCTERRKITSATDGEESRNPAKK